jgi:hypothetical protein
MKAGILVLVSIFALGYITRPLFRNFITSATSDKSACLELLGNTTTEENGVAFIIGSIRNNCDRKFSNVTISFKLDSTPRPMDSLPEAGAYAYSRDVQPGQIAQFKSALPVSKNSTYRFDGISAY